MEVVQGDPMFCGNQGINPVHYKFRLKRSSKSSDLLSASTLSKDESCFEGVPVVQEVGYEDLQEATQMPCYHLCDIVNKMEGRNGIANTVKVEGSNSENDSAIFIANLMDSKADLRYKIEGSTRQFMYAVYSHPDTKEKHIVLPSKKLQAAADHLSPWLCSTNTSPDIAVYKLKKSAEPFDLTKWDNHKSDLPVALFEVISDTPWQTSRQLAIKLIELLQLFRAYECYVQEVSGVVLPRSKPLKAATVPKEDKLPSIEESSSNESDAGPVSEITAAVNQLTISGGSSRENRSRSQTDQSFAVKVVVKFDSELLRFVVSYSPLKGADVVNIVKEVLESVTQYNEFMRCSNNLFLKLNAEELSTFKNKTLAKERYFEQCGGLSDSVPVQLFSATSLVFKVQTKTKDVVLKRFARGHEKYLALESVIRQRSAKEIQHVLLSEKLLTPDPLVIMFAFEYLVQLSTDEAKSCIRDLLKAVRIAVDELHLLGYAHLDIRLPNICFKKIPGEEKNFIAVLIDLERARPGISTTFTGRYESCMYQLKRTLEDIDFLQIYWMAFWLLLDDRHGVSYHSMDNLKEGILLRQPEYCRLLHNWILAHLTSLQTKLSDQWDEFMKFIPESKSASLSDILGSKS